MAVLSVGSEASGLRKDAVLPSPAPYNRGARYILKPKITQRINDTCTPNRLVYAITLGLLAALGPLCIDLYLPALPELARDLGSETATAQLSLTAGLLGLGAGRCCLVR